MGVMFVHPFKPAQFVALPLYRDSKKRAEVDKVMMDFVGQKLEYFGKKNVWFCFEEKNILML